MEHFDYILRLLWLALRLVYEHPATPVALALLRDAAMFVLVVAATYLLEELVLKRVVQPAPSPTEDALLGRVEALSHALGRAEAERDAARQEAQRTREGAAAERARADRLDAEFRGSLRPPRRRGPRARRKRRRGQYP